MFQGQIGPKLGKTAFSEPSIQYFLIFTLDCATLRSLIKSGGITKNHQLRVELLAQIAVAVYS
jgi:hypothetical protein